MSHLLIKCLINDEHEALTNRSILLLYVMDKKIEFDEIITIL